MDDMLNIEAIAALEPISSFAPQRMYELLDYCRLEVIPKGQDPLQALGLKGQSLYLVDGRLELAYGDHNRLKISAGTEWTKRPLGKGQPVIVAATVLEDATFLCVNNDLLDIMEARDRRMSRESGGQQTADRRPLSGGYVLNSGMNSLQHFKLWPFMQLSPEHLGKLLRLIEVVLAWDNETVIREGEAGDYYYVLERGYATVSRRVGRVDMVLAALKPGDAFGEEALISGARRNATITMKSNGVLLRLKQSDFFELLREPLLRHLNYPAAAAKVALGAAWLDVRHPPEYRRDKLPGAINVPLNDIRSAIGVLGKDRSYIAYCQDGRNSSVAAFILAQAGYDVSVLDGGLRAAAGGSGAGTPDA
jgi:rhodanese-related sulfurtransferase